MPTNAVYFRVLREYFGVSLVAQNQSAVSPHKSHNSIQSNSIEIHLRQRFIRRLGQIEYYDIPPPHCIDATKRWFVKQLRGKTSLACFSERAKTLARNATNTRIAVQGQIIDHQPNQPKTRPRFQAAIILFLAVCQAKEVRQRSCQRSH